MKSATDASNLVTFRTLKENDFDDLKKLFASRFPHNPLDETVFKDYYLNPQKNVFIVAEVGGQFAGGGSLEIGSPRYLEDVDSFDKSEARLFKVGVLPEFEKRGIGTAITQEAIRTAQQLGKTSIALCVNEENMAAWRIYKKLGFQEIEKKAVPHGNFVFMLWHNDTKAHQPTYPTRTYCTASSQEQRFADILSHPKSLSFPEKWVLALEFMYTDADRNAYIQGVDEFLVSRFGRRSETDILGVGSGTGWFEIGLRQLGWGKVIWSDVDRDMKRFFEEDLQTFGLDIPRVQTDCKRLDENKNFKEKFHAVFFRGGGFPYVAEPDFDPNHPETFAPTSKAKIAASFRAIYNIVRPGGLFYVDLVGRDELNYFHTQRGREIQSPLEKVFPDKTISGKKVQLHRETRYDFERKIREGKRWLTIDGHVDFAASHGYVPDYDGRSYVELENLLKVAGFSHVEERRFPGEKNYVAFIATKDRE